MKPHFYIRNAWYVAGVTAGFKPGELIGRKIAGRPIVLWRTKEGNVVAFDDRCAHKRFPLSKGRLMEDGTLECAYHGLRYDGTGKCVAVPSQPGAPIPPNAKTNPFPLIEQDGLVWVWPGDPAKKDTCRPPRTPELVDGERESIASARIVVPSNYILLIENIVDNTHFYPLHDGNIGDLANSSIPGVLTEGVVDGNTYVGMVREVKNYIQPAYYRDWFGYELIDRYHSHVMISPGLSRVTLRVAPPGKLGTDLERGYYLFQLHTPIDEHNHIWQWVINSSHHMSHGDPTTSIAKRFADAFPNVGAQDVWALELQQDMFGYADEGYSEVFLKADTAVRRVRQVFLDLLRAERPESDIARAAE